MRVALAHDHLYQTGGAERVLRSLSELYSAAPIYTLICNQELVTSFAQRDVKTSFLQRMPWGVRHFKWYLRLMPTAWESFDFSKFDVVISSASAFVKGIVTSPETMHVSYCHSPTRYLWSDANEYVESLRLPKALQLTLIRNLSSLRAWDQLAADRVDYFIANSQYVASRIRKYYRRDSTVIYPPVETSSFSIAPAIDDYYVILSRLRPYKRVDLAIQAFNHLKLPLLVIGGGQEYLRLKALAKNNVRFLGEVSDERRNYFMSRCRAFIHPQVEDFGITAVEALASGRPVIAFRGGGALETLIEGVTGSFFDEQSWESLAYCVLNFNLKMYDPQSLRAYAMKFDSAIFQNRIRSFIEEKYRKYKGELSR